MGLDNGIEVKAKRPEMEDFVKDLETEIGDICYWRKCWNVRADMIEYLSKNIDKDIVNDIYNQVYEYPILIQDIPEIIKIIIKFYDMDYYENANNDIWGYPMMCKINGKNLARLGSLLMDIKDNNITDEDIAIIFYDSY